MVWEAIFLLVVLKIPVVYLGIVVWWAIRAEPRPEEGAALPLDLDPVRPGPCDWRERLRERRGRPRTGPRAPGVRRPAAARAMMRR